MADETDMPVVVDQPAQKPASKVTVIVPCYGQLEYTRISLPRLIRLSRLATEIVCLDFDSLDGTPQYIAGLSQFAPLPVRRVHVPCDLPMGKALLQAFETVETDLVALVSTDTLVAELWLEQLTALINASPMLGLVGTMSSLNVANQYTGPVPYRKTLDAALPTLTNGTQAEQRLAMRDVDSFMRWWREEHQGKWSEEESIAGYCLLARKAALEACKLDDLPTALGWLNTDALGKRLRQANWRQAVCRDLMVHTFGVKHYIPTI